MYYIIFISYYSSDSPSSLKAESLSVTQSVSSLSSPSYSHRMAFSDPSKTLLMQHFLKDLTIMLSGMAFYAADTHRANSEGAASKGRLKERYGLEPRTNFFSFKKSAKNWFRFGCGLDSRIYGIYHKCLWFKDEDFSFCNSWHCNRNQNIYRVMKSVCFRRVKINSFTNSNDIHKNCWE